MKKKMGFTLIELLVVIAIIGLLATLSIISLSVTRSKTRDTRRVADVRQMQTALVLYENNYNQYPESENEEAHIALASSGIEEFINPVPQAPTPADGTCNSEQNSYYYWSDGLDYKLYYCLGDNLNNLQAGPSYASPISSQEEFICRRDYENCQHGVACCNNNCCGEFVCCPTVCCEGVCCPSGQTCNNGICGNTKI